MKKILIAIILIVAIGGFAYWSSTKSNATTPVTTTTDTSNPTSTPVETTNPAGGTTGSTGTTVTGQYKDGTYTGSVADAFYGNLQVAAVISGGKLTDVTFLQAPNDQRESQQVNGHSSPILRQEAITAQSANVNIVSGATQSSEAFQKSLGNALSQAQS
jgi:uncharacterized protein with FMN-binding domain